MKIDVILKYNAEVDPDGFSGVRLEGLTMEQFILLQDIVFKQDNEDVEILAIYQRGKNNE